MMKLQTIIIALLWFCAVGVSAEDGAALYQSLACAGCHGQSGEGMESLDSPQIAGQNDDYLREQLINFRDNRRGNHPEDTYGQVMRTSSQTLSDADIEVLSTYIADLPSQEVLSSAKGDSEQGAIIYAANCAACHGHKAQGVSSLYAPNLTILQPWYIKAQLEAYTNDWRGHAESTTRAKSMRSIVVQLNNDEEIQDVIARLASLRESPSE